MANKGNRDARVAEIMQPGLDLRKLAVVSRARSQDPKGFNQKMNKWSVLEWGGATAGEMGEATGAMLSLYAHRAVGNANNVAKKIVRLRGKTRGNLKKGDQSEKHLLRQLGKEIADAIQYLVLWADSEGLDPSNDIVETFNKKSKELGYDFML